MTTAEPSASPSGQTVTEHELAPSASEGNRHE
jgi:hypothetical protein